MEEWNPYKISKMDKEILDIYLRYGYGFMKMYDCLYFTNLSDETAVMTLEEFSMACEVE